MEITPISPEQRTALVKNNTQGSPQYSKGEIISAEVISQEGEMVTLLAEGEKYFTAKIISGLQFSAGDTLELLVNGKQDGSFVMTMVSGDADKVIISSGDNVNQAAVLKDSSIMHALESAGLPADENNISVVSDAMSQNPQLDVKSAVFMLSNKIPFTKENINAIMSFETSQTSAGNKLIDLAGIALFSEDYVAGSDIVKSDAAAYGYQTQNSYQAANNGFSMDNTAINTLTETLQETQTMDSTIVQMPDAEIQTDSSLNGQQAMESSVFNENIQSVGANNIQASESSLNFEIRNEQIQVINDIIETESTIVKENTDKPPVKENTFTAKADIAAKDENIKELVSKVVKSFVKIDELINKETNIKKAGLSNIQKYLELKRTIDSSDVLNKGALSEKAQELISQSRVASDVKDYNFYHVPINFGQNQQTAEIFVYKRSGKKQRQEDEPLTILIGLDTQNLGRVEVLTKAYNKSLSVKIGRENEDADAIIKSKTDELRELLSETGYSLSSLSIEKLFEKTTPVNAKDVLEASSDGRRTMIDYMV